MTESPEDRPNPGRNDPDPQPEQQPPKDRRDAPPRERDPIEKDPSPEKGRRDRNVDNPDQGVDDDREG